MRVLGLDISTKTGWGLMENAKLIESGVQDFAVKRGESPGMKFYRFRAWIESMCKMGHPDVIYYEQAHYRGGAATECCVGLITRVHEIASLMGINYMPVHTSTLKKFVTGHGKAGKQAIMDIISQRFGIKMIDDNHADGIALCWYGYSELTGGR